MLRIRHFLQEMFAPALPFSLTDGLEAGTRCWNPCGNPPRGICFIP